jgi:hypothetical protein
VTVIAVFPGTLGVPESVPVDENESPNGSVPVSLNMAVGNDSSITWKLRGVPTPSWTKSGLVIAGPLEFVTTNGIVAFAVPEVFLATISIG